MTGVLTHYIRLIATKQGIDWTTDNDAELNDVELAIENRFRVLLEAIGLLQKQCAMHAEAIVSMRATIQAMQRTDEKLHETDVEIVALCETVMKGTR